MLNLGVVENIIDELISKLFDRRLFALIHTIEIKRDYDVITASNIIGKGRRGANLSFPVEIIRGRNRGWSFFKMKI